MAICKFKIILCVMLIITTSFVIAFSVKTFSKEDNKVEMHNWQHDSNGFLASKDEMKCFNENFSNLSDEYLLFLMIRIGDHKELVDALLGSELLPPLHQTDGSVEAGYLRPRPIRFYESPFSRYSIRVIYHSNIVSSVEFYGAKQKREMQDEPLSEQLIEWLKKRFGSLSSETEKRIIDTFDKLNSDKEGEQKVLELLSKSLDSSVTLNEFEVFLVQF